MPGYLGPVTLPQPNLPHSIMAQIEWMRKETTVMQSLAIILDGINLIYYVKRLYILGLSVFVFPCGVSL